MNYLWQLSHVMMLEYQQPEISKSQLRVLRRLGAKTSLRLSAEVKHSICKGCDALLLVGISASVQGHHLVCRECSTRIYIPPCVHDANPEKQ